MEILDISAIFAEAEVNEEQLVLNFDNSDSIQQKKLADDNLTTAKYLLTASEKDPTIEKATKKVLDKHAMQAAHEAVEKYQKSVIYADEKHEKIPHNLHENLEKTHNTKFQQRETQKAGINILDEEDIDMLYKGIVYTQSPYNAMRFTEQKNIKHENAKNAVAVAEKAKHNLEGKINDQKHKKHKYRAGNSLITLPY